MKSHWNRSRSDRFGQAREGTDSVKQKEQIRSSKGGLAPGKNVLIPRAKLAISGTPKYTSIFDTRRVIEAL